MWMSFIRGVSCVWVHVDVQVTIPPVTPPHISAESETGRTVWPHRYLMCPLPPGGLVEIWWLTRLTVARNIVFAIQKTHTQVSSYSIRLPSEVNCAKLQRRTLRKQKQRAGNWLCCDTANAPKTKRRKIGRRLPCKLFLEHPPLPLNKQRSLCKYNWAHLLVAPFSAVKNHSACVHPPYHGAQFVKGIRLLLLLQQRAPTKPNCLDFRHSKDCSVLSPRPTYPPPSLVSVSLSRPASRSDVSDTHNKSPAVSSDPPQEVSSATLSPFESSAAPRRPSPKWALGGFLFFLFEGGPWCKFADCVALCLWNVPGSRPEVDA